MAGLREALRGERHEVATGMTMGDVAHFGYRCCTRPPLCRPSCRLAAHQDPNESVTGIAKHRDAPAIVGEASPACLTRLQTQDGERPEDTVGVGRAPGGHVPVSRGGPTLP
jgi:protein-L-isoaspartate(D-aspartate) O-methyltransferase